LVLAALVAGCGGKSGTKDVLLSDSVPWDLVADLHAAADAPADHSPGEVATDLLDAQEEIPLVCEPGHIECEDIQTRKTCAEDGMGWTLKECEPGFACHLGYCREQVCTPGEPEGKCLTPDSYSLCDETGTQYVEEFCQVPLKCFEGQCVDYQCNPGQVACKGLTAVQECQLTDTGGAEWVVVEECLGGACQEGVCVSACEVNLKDSYLGCDYWAVDLDNVEGGKIMPVAVVVSLPSTAVEPAQITLTDMSKDPPEVLTPAQLGVQDMSVPPGELESFLLPMGLDIDGSVQTNRAVHIESTAPVTVHQFNPINGLGVYTNDASLLLPADMGGELYYVMSWPMRKDKVEEGYTFRGFAAVVATQEGTTTVSIEPTSKTLAGPGVAELLPYPADPYVFTLEQGEVLNLETEGPEGTDLTGTRISADQ